MDYSQAAFEAIEEWVSANRSQHNNYRWLGKKPISDWGYNANSWSPQMNDIRRAFERKIGFIIPFPPRERRKTAAFAMNMNQYILARKAETSSNTRTTALQELSA